MEMRGYHHGDLRAALVSAAIDALEGGDADFSLRSIARSAGVSAMAPYRHFADKKALRAAVASEGFTRLRDRLAIADSDPEPERALLAQGLAYVDFADAHPALFRLMFQCEADAATAGDSPAYAVLLARVAAIVPDAARESATLLCWASVHGLAILRQDKSAAIDRDATVSALRQLVEGLPRR